LEKAGQLHYHGRRMTPPNIPAHKLLNWFQMPVQVMDRAIEFYQKVLGSTFHRIDTPAEKHAFFILEPREATLTGGELVESRVSKPSPDGVTIYLHARDGLDEALARVEAAGGKILAGKTSIGENGLIALIQDTEGNRVGLHSMH
jgi:hypothetical protein